jgi:copper chaperone CopZ
MKTKVTLSASPATGDTAHIEKSLEAVAGVAAVEVQGAEVLVEHEGVNESELVKALGNLGFSNVAIQR